MIRWNIIYDFFFLNWFACGLQQSIEFSKQYKAETNIMRNTIVKIQDNSKNYRRLWNIILWHISHILTNVFQIWKYAKNKVRIINLSVGHCLTYPEASAVSRLGLKDHSYDYISHGCGGIIANEARPSVPIQQCKPVSKPQSGGGV